MDFFKFKKANKLSHKQLTELAWLCGAFAALILVAVAINGRGSSLLARVGITPGSQTASYCLSWIDDCTVHVDFTAGYPQATPNPVPYGQSATISWRVPNADACSVYLLTGYTTYEYTDPGGGFGVPDGGAGGAVILAQSSGTYQMPNYTLVYTTPNGNAAKNGSWTTPPLTATPQYGYYVNCVNGGSSDSGSSGYKPVNIIVAPLSEPVLSITANPTTVQNPGHSTLTWTTQNTTSCTVWGAGYALWGGTNGTGDTATYGYPSTDITYELRCQSPLGQRSAYATMYVTQPAPAPTCPAGYTGTYPNCTAPPAAACPAGYTGTYPNCTAPVTQVCPAGYTGTYPNCVAPAVPAPTTLTSFVASPATIPYNSSATLVWQGTPGTNFYSCALAGAEYGNGVWFSALPGSTNTSPLTATTAYSMACYDTTYGWTNWLSTLVTVATPVSADACSNIAGTQAAAPANGHANADGTCSPNAGYQADPSNPSVFIPVTPTTPAPAPAPAPTQSCSGAHQLGTPPNCSCEYGFLWQGGTCVQVQCPGLHEVGWPSCNCAAGFSRDGTTQMCIHPPVLNIKVNGQDAVRVRRGTQVSVTWSATGITANSCHVTTNTGATLSSAASGTVPSTVANQTTYTLRCTNEAGSAVSKAANATLIPDVVEQ